MKLYYSPEGDTYTDNFSVSELRCHCKKCNRQIPHQIEPQRLMTFQIFRVLLGWPFTPDSAFRCPLHPDEIKKDKPGEHNRGAMDIPFKNSVECYQIVNTAMLLGFTGMKVYTTFVHIDLRVTTPVIWQ